MFIPVIILPGNFKTALEVPAYKSTKTKEDVFSSKLCSTIASLP